MTRKEIDRLIEEHLAAEQAGDPDGSVAVYSDDVVHDLVGSPLGTLRGPDEARRFYDSLR
jgi:ketosteroid isomerase-like protein